MMLQTPNSMAGRTIAKSLELVLPMYPVGGTPECHWKVTLWPDLRITPDVVRRHMGDVLPVGTYELTTSDDGGIYVKVRQSWSNTPDAIQKLFNWFLTPAPAYPLSYDS